VRDLGAQVVSNVGLSDTVEEETVNVAVDGAECAALEVEGLVAVVGEKRVGVLEVRDHYEPVLLRASA